MPFSPRCHVSGSRSGVEGASRLGCDAGRLGADVSEDSSGFDKKRLCAQRHGVTSEDDFQFPLSPPSPPRPADTLGLTGQTQATNATVSVRMRWLPKCLCPVLAQSRNDRLSSSSFALASARTYMVGSAGLPNTAAEFIHLTCQSLHAALLCFASQTTALFFLHHECKEVTKCAHKVALALLTASTSLRA